MPASALEDPRTSFFRDPRDGRAVTDMFALRTAVGASSNYAKFVYTSPPVRGATLALSFTPTQGKQLAVPECGAASARPPGGFLGSGAAL